MMTPLSTYKPTLLQMPPMVDLERLFALLESKDPQLRLPCLWLLLGENLGNILVGDTAPTVEQLTELLLMLRREEPDLIPLGRALVSNSPDAAKADVEYQLDQLAENTDWSHPSQILPKPRADNATLLELCLLRLSTTKDSRQFEQLQRVRERLQIAVNVDEVARRRREEMQQEPVEQAAAQV